MMIFRAVFPVYTSLDTSSSMDLRWMRSRLLARKTLSQVSTKDNRSVSLISKVDQ